MIILWYNAKKEKHGRVYMKFVIPGQNEEEYACRRSDY
jgi:hypothetical protein